MSCRKGTSFNACLAFTPARLQHVCSLPPGQGWASNCWRCELRLRIVNHSKKYFATVVAIACVASLAVIAAASPRVLAQSAPPEGGELLLKLDPDKSEFHWTLDTTLHTVHGTFKFKSGELRINPSSGVASGEILVPATSAESGNDGRDKKMHKDVL